MLLQILDNLNSKRIFLALASIARKSMLEKAGLKFEISASTFEENLPYSDFETSSGYVIKTSEIKMLHKIEEFKKSNVKADIIITAYTIISIDDHEIIEKP